MPRKKTYSRLKAEAEVESKTNVKAESKTKAKAETKTKRTAKAVRKKSILPPPCEKPATDVYTFENLRKRGYTYIDKTRMLLSLVDESIGNQFFLARPRRFGKSLCVSTL